MTDETVKIPKALYDEWIAAQDAALDWADQSARAFPIETAPKQGALLAWSEVEQDWIHFETVLEYEYFKAAGNEHFTHWTPLPPPPSNPPLPEPLERLGEVLRRVKGVS